MSDQPAPHHTAPAGQRDGRVVLAAILAVYFAGLLVCSLNMPLDDAWNKLQVPALGTFGDLLFITRDGEAVLHGRPKTEGFFYPPACYWFAHLGLGERHNTIAGIVMSIGFFAAALFALGRVKREHVPYLAALFCSPSIMLGVSRGNIDLFIFMLLVIAVVLLNTRPALGKFFGYALILYAALLKLYPIFTGIVAVKEKRTRTLGILLTLGALFGLYLWLYRADFHEMNKLAPRHAFLSYGAAVSFDRLDYGNPANATYGLVLSSLVLLAAALFAWRKGHELSEATDESRALDFFRAGAIVYLGCFALIQYNFIYRHITLLLTLPQWLAWRQKGGRTGKLATVALASILLAFWLPRYVRNWWNLDQLCDWILFALYAYAFVATLPAEIRSLLPLRPRGAAAAASPS